VVENQRGEPGFVLRVNPEAFVSKLFKRGIHVEVFQSTMMLTTTPSALS
jgi:hypothetical protein